MFPAICACILLSGTVKLWSYHVMLNNIILYCIILYSVYIFPPAELVKLCVLWLQHEWENVMKNNRSWERTVFVDPAIKTRAAWQENSKCGKGEVRYNTDEGNRHRNERDKGRAPGMILKNYDQPVSKYLMHCIEVIFAFAFRKAISHYAAMITRRVMCGEGNHSCSYKGVRGVGLFAYLDRHSSRGPQGR